MKTGLEKQEFINLCVKCGYCNRKTAKKYAETHDELTEDDFIAVYRMDEDRTAEHKPGRRPVDPHTGGTTTKHYTVFNSHKG